MIPQEEINRIKLIVKEKRLYDYNIKKSIIEFHNKYLPYKPERATCMACVIKAFNRIKVFLHEEN